MMTERSSSQAGPDFTRGFPLAAIVEGGMVTGHVGDKPALLVPQGGELFAIGATCTHYGAPLADGLLVGDTIRCPWHHACFSLRTGQVLRPPALTGLKCWRVEQHDGCAVVREALPAAQPLKLTAAGLPESVVVVGGGAAGTTAAVTLRREGYQGPVTMLSTDRLDIDGDPAARDCMVTYWRNDKRLAVATVGHDLDSLRAEVAFEQETPA